MQLTTRPPSSHFAAMHDWAINYMKHVLEAKDWSANRLASEAGVASTTISRPLKEPDYPHKLNRTTIAKIHAASGIDPAPFAPKDMPYLADAAPSGLAEPPTPMRIQAGGRNSLSILIDGPLVRIQGVLDKEGAKKLRESLDHIIALLSD